MERVTKHWNGISRRYLSSLEVFVTCRHDTKGRGLVMELSSSRWLNLVVLKAFSNPGDSRILTSI